MSTFEIDVFEVENYKPIQDSGQISVGDITTFIGKNDAGKSSFLEALFIFLDGGKPENYHFHKHEADSIRFTARIKTVPSELQNVLDEDYLPNKGYIFIIEKEFTRRERTTPKAETYVNGEKIAKGAVIQDGEELYKAESRDYIWDFFPEPLPILAERDVNEETKLKGGTYLNKLLFPVLKGGGLEDEIEPQMENLTQSLEETSDGIGEKLTETCRHTCPM